MYIYLQYKFDRKLRMIKLFLDRVTFMKLYPKYSVEKITLLLTKNNEDIVREFDGYNKNDISSLSRILNIDSMLFLDIVKSGEQNVSKIKLWKTNMAELAELLNEIDDRKWSKNAGEKLFHEFQDSILSNMNDSLNGFESTRDFATRVAMFIA